MAQISLDLTDRTTLIHSLPHGGIGAEIGVAYGGFSQVILEQNHPKELYLIDCWKHQDKSTYVNDPANSPDLQQQLLYKEISERYKDCPHIHVIRGYSVPVASVMQNNYFDWVYIDADHLQVLEDIEAWWPKVKPGGWLVGHDYVMIEGFIDVKPKVDQFVAKHDLSLQVTRGDTGIYEKNYPSWIFRKPTNA